MIFFLRVSSLRRGGLSVVGVAASQDSSNTFIRGGVLLGPAEHRLRNKHIRGTFVSVGVEVPHTCVLLCLVDWLPVR